MAQDTTIRLRRIVESDRHALRELVCELQDYEREIEPARRSSDEFASGYVASLLAKCNQQNGAIIVAAQGEKVVGFLSLFPGEKLDDELNEPVRMSYVSDLMVTASFRHSGIGRMLLAEAEKISMEQGVRLISLNVLAGNQLAREFYAAAGFSEYELLLTKAI